MAVHLKRAYEAASPSDGVRVLVDRLWPCGVLKATARIDLWLADIAPSTQLWEWFGQDPARWTAFQRRYRAELRRHPRALAQLRWLAARGPLTLVYRARDTEHNNAVVLRRVLLAGRGTARYPIGRDVG